MNHFTLPRFWQYYRQLPAQIQELADKNYALLKADPFHPSLHFKKVGENKQLWSCVSASIIVLWVWIKAKA